MNEDNVPLVEYFEWKSPDEADKAKKLVEAIEIMARAAKAAGCNWADLLHPLNPVEDKSRELLEQMRMIYFNEGLLIRSAFTMEEAIEAMTKLVAEYPVDAATTLTALRNRDAYLSRRYLELLCQQKNTTP